MSSDERPQIPGSEPNGEVFDLAPEVQTPRTKAPPLPAAPPPSEVEVVDTHEDDIDDEHRENPPVGEPLISDKLVSWQRWGGVGVGLTLVGAYFGYHFEPRFSILRGLMVLYYAPLLTLLGVGAGFAMATLEGRRVGGKNAWRELATRLLTCVAAGLAVAAIDFPLVGRAGGAVLGAGIYFGLLMVLLGWPAARAARLASAHFVLAVLIYIPVAVARWMAEK
ncbi:MAG TPA: hypothetical protein VHN77_06840 [Phycisphaerales bacterium]|nr:hypothetical protein [Phycisphaerales bacterium]